MIKLQYIPPRNVIDRVLRVVQRNQRGGSMGDVVVLLPGETANITLDDAYGVMVTCVESHQLIQNQTGYRGSGLTPPASAFGNLSEMDVLTTPPQGLDAEGNPDGTTTLHPDTDDNEENNEDNARRRGESDVEELE